MASTPLSNNQAWKALGSGAAYATARPMYPKSLYKLLVDYHRRTGGQMELAVDLGCGPGTVTTQLSPLFCQVLGTDLSEQMFNSAPPLKNVKYATADSSDLPHVASDSVDLVTAGTSAHWFDHPSWWKEMTRIVKPGGTVACWTFTPGFMNDASSPSSPPYPESLRILLETTQRYSGPFLPFRSAGNAHTYSLYDALPGPDVEPSTSTAWETAAQRWKWGWEDGRGYLHSGPDAGVWAWAVQPSNADTSEASEEVEKEMKSTISLDELAAYYASVSPVIAYRRALPAGEPDWVEQQIEKIKQEGGEGWDGSTRVNVRRVLSLVVWKKKA